MSLPYEPEPLYVDDSLDASLRPAYGYFPLLTKEGETTGGHVTVFWTDAMLDATVFPFLATELVALDELDISVKVTELSKLSDADGTPGKILVAKLAVAPSPHWLLEKLKRSKYVADRLALLSNHFSHRPIETQYEFTMHVTIGEDPESEKFKKRAALFKPGAEFRFGAACFAVGTPKTVYNARDYLKRT